MFLFNEVKMSCIHVFIAWKALLYKRKYCNKIVLVGIWNFNREKDSQKQWWRTKDKLLWQLDSEPVYRKRRLGCPWFYKWKLWSMAEVRITVEESWVISWRWNMNIGQNNYSCCIYGALFLVKRIYICVCFRNLCR